MTVFINFRWKSKRILSHIFSAWARIPIPKFHLLICVDNFFKQPCLFFPLMYLKEVISIVCVSHMSMHLCFKDSKLQWTHWTGAHHWNSFVCLFLSFTIIFFFPFFRGIFSDCLSSFWQSETITSIESTMLLTYTDLQNTIVAIYYFKQITNGSARNSN